MENKPDRGTLNNKIVNDNKWRNYLQTIQILLNSFSSRVSKQEFLDYVVNLIQQESGCKFVGIRVLDDDGCIPYQSFVGFSREFWQSENMIQIAKEDCSCTRLVSERLRPFDRPIINKAGSLCCNDTLLFAQSLSADEQKMYRGACNDAGYRSVAVVPVRHREGILGVIHLADLRTNQLSQITMELIESIAPLIGEVLNRDKMEQSLRINQNNRAILESIVAGISSLAYVVDMDTCELIYTSKALDNLYGERLAGRKCFGIFGFSSPCPGCPVQTGNADDINSHHTWERFDHVHARYYLAERKAMNWPDGRIVYLAFATDITRQKEAENALRRTNAELERTVGELQQLTASLEEEITERQAAQEALIENQTELKRYATRLEETNKELKAFANIVAHDLRTPMVNLDGFSKELGKSLAELKQILLDAVMHLPENVRQKTGEILERDLPEALQFIDLSVDRMDTMVAALVKLAHLGTNKMNYQAVNMAELVSAVLASFSKQIAGRNIQVKCGLLPQIQTDRQAMEQIMGNLLSNAIKYLEPERRGEITISCAVSGDEYIFSIQDNGLGIAAEDQEKIFEIFRQAGKQDMVGQGMGLAYVRTLVRQLGGKVWCESDLGTGTIIRFTTLRKPSPISGPFNL